MTTATSSCRSASTPEGPAAAWAARRLEVADVRCWRRAELDLPAGLVVVVGPNGAGKTSLIEAVTLGCLGVSPRTAREAEVVRRGAEALHVALDLEGPPGAHRREIGFAPGRGRRLRLDGEPVRSLAAWRARAVLVFLPDELRAVKGPPAARRRAPRPHARSRLRGLRRGRRRLPGGPRAAQRAPAPHPGRRRVGGEPAGVGGAHGRPGGAGGRRPPRRGRRAGGPVPRLAGGARGRPGRGAAPRDLARPRWRDVADDALEGALAAALRERRRRDVQAAQTLSGPHRDDLFIGAGPADLRRSGSQGEQRTAALALLLAARDHLRERAARPILLLDDVLSELDPGRRRLLLEAVRDGGQTLVTSADPAVADALSEPPDALVRVEGGSAEVTPPRRRRRRRREPASAADVLARFRRRAGGGSGAGAETAAAALAWADVVGRAAADHSVPVRRSRAGVLTIACSSASWAHELSARRAELAARLAERCPDAGVSTLRFAVADHAVRAAPSAPARGSAARRSEARRSGTPPPPPPTGIGEPALRELVARAAAASAARRRAR